MRFSSLGFPNHANDHLLNTGKSPLNYLIQGLLCQVNADPDQNEQVTKKLWISFAVFSIQTDAVSKNATTLILTSFKLLAKAQVTAVIVPAVLRFLLEVYSATVKDVLLPKTENFPLNITPGSFSFQSSLTPK